MHHKWYEYAASLKKHINTKSKKSFYFIGAFFVVSFSIPLLKYNIRYWLLLIIPYCLALFFCFREKDEYAKSLLNVGSMLLFAGAGCASEILIHSEYFLIFVLCVLVFLVFYEALVVVKIKRKRKLVSSKAKALVGTGVILLGVIIGKTLGSFIIKKSGFFLLMLFLGIFFFIAAIMFLQKYVIYKVLAPKCEQENRDEEK